MGLWFCMKLVLVVSQLGLVWRSCALALVQCGRRPIPNTFDQRPRTTTLDQRPCNNDQDQRHWAKRLKGIGPTANTNIQRPKTNTKDVRQTTNHIGPTSKLRVGHWYLIVRRVGVGLWFVVVGLCSLVFCTLSLDVDPWVVSYSYASSRSDPPMCEVYDP